MAGRFSFSGGGVRDPWFRLGPVEVGSAGVMALACGVAMILGAFSPALIGALDLQPASVLAGQVWRLATWPLATAVDLWAVISIALLWYFGNFLEAQIGRRAMTFMLAALTLLPAVLAVALNVTLGGVRLIEFVIILLFIADNPHRPFFFGIPAWILGVVFVAVQLLQLIQMRQGAQLVIFLFMMALGALAGRGVGLLSEYQFIPKLPLPSGLTGRQRAATRRAKNAPQRNHRGQVVRGPWSDGVAPTDNTADQAELDALLDKISADGLDSLSKAQKQRLDELSKKLR